MGEGIGEHAQLPDLIDHGQCFVLDKYRDEGRRAERDIDARDFIHLDDISEVLQHV